jgi:tetratricopeptide (TPR) repeat protein
MEVWLRYAGLWIFPYQQTIFHHIPDLNPFSVKGVGIFVAWITVLGLGFKYARKHPLSLFALGGAILFLLPSSSFAALKENMAEHRAHQFGLFFLLFLGSFLNQKSISWKIAPVFAVVLSFLTYQRNQVWNSEVRLWQEATIHSPDSAPAWYGLGDAHRFAKQFEPALAAYSTCTRLDKEYFDCWNNFGITYAEMGNANKATEIWEQVLRINPRYCKAHTNLGFLAYQEENWENAIIEFRSTVVNCPDNIIAHYGLGLIYYRPRFDKEKATYHLDRVLQINPNFDYASDARKKLLELTW